MNPGTILPKCLYSNPLFCNCWLWPTMLCALPDIRIEHWNMKQTKTCAHTYMNMQQKDFPKINRIFHIIKAIKKRNNILNFVPLEFCIWYPPDEIVQTLFSYLVENQQGSWMSSFDTISCCDTWQCWCPYILMMMTILMMMSVVAMMMTIMMIILDGAGDPIV